VRIAEALGAAGTRVRTTQELRTALQTACGTTGVQLIEVGLDREDMSPTLRRLSRKIRL